MTRSTMSLHDKYSAGQAEYDEKYEHTREGLDVGHPGTPTTNVWIDRQDEQTQMVVKLIGTSQYFKDSCPSCPDIEDADEASRQRHYFTRRTFDDIIPPIVDEFETTYFRTQTNKPHYGLSDMLIRCDHDEEDEALVAIHNMIEVMFDRYIELTKTDPLNHVEAKPTDTLQGKINQIKAGVSQCHKDNKDN